MLPVAPTNGAQPDFGSEEKLCPGCGDMKTKQAYTTIEWKRVDKNDVRVGHCFMCLARHKEDGCPFQCTMCWMWKPDTAFEDNMRHWNSSQYRVCDDCTPRRTKRRRSKLQPDSYGRGIVRGKICR